MRDFWSSRRAAVAAEEARGEAARAEAVEAEARAAREARRAEMTDAELCAELGLPDPDVMRPGDDFAAFMGRAVPERLRRRALRRLWGSNPVLANLDGLVDHGDDFTDAATCMPDLRTTYQVGKGLLRHVEEMARQAELRAMPAADEGPGGEAPDEAPDETHAEPGPIMAEIREPGDVAAPADEPQPAPLRHMRFRFAG